MSLIAKAMAKAGGGSYKTPTENVHELRNALAGLADRSHPPDKHVLEAANKYLARVKSILQGSPEAPVVPDVTKEGTRAVLADAALLVHLVEMLSLLDFEARKDAVHIFHTSMRFVEGGAHPAVAILTARPDLVERIICGYNTQDVALNYGAMLRDCVHHDSLNRMVLNSPSFYNFFSWVEAKEFEVASDAFATFKECLTLHRGVVAEFLEAQYEPFFKRYNALLESTNYVTRRLSIKLLGELLLHAESKTVMLRFVNDLENLKLIMNCLKDSSKSIQFEAFHVFKVFVVVNRDKSQGVMDVLRHNRDKLLKYMSNFQSERAGEQGFQEEKTLVVSVLEKLTPA